MIRKKILIAGGAGFLGSHLCLKKVQEGYSVICVDNLFTGSLDNLHPLFDHPHFAFLEHDICDPLDIPVDEVYNFACPASPVHYQSNPIQTVKTNVYGTMNLLELAVRYRSKFFQASTSEVYGDPQIHPQTERYWGNVNPTGIRSCYDEGKRCAETLCFDFHRKYQLSIRVGRIFNTYGPRMHPQDGRVVSNFIIQALSGKPLTIYGEGKQTRSFCYVNDLIEGICLLMAYEGEERGPFNLGNPQEWYVKDLAELILKMTGSQSPLVFQPLPQDDPKQRKPDISQARSLLGWEPKVQLQEGLERTIAYFSPLFNDLSCEGSRFFSKIAKS
ncbi:MAG: SDR family oxidoreductase [Simkaniaceae bacterium]|nr:SDR family oxidoreductase [Simkaniaceae bacterium]